MRPLLRGMIRGLILGMLVVSAGEALSHSDPLATSLGLESGWRRTSSSAPGQESWWGRDKRLHLVVSAGMVGVGFHLLHDRWHCAADESRTLAVSMTALAGVIKELTDGRKTPSTRSYKDLLADGLGILVGVFLFTQ